MAKFSHPPTMRPVGVGHDMRADDGATCDLFITLVHGTWPRGGWQDVLLTPFYDKWPSRFLPRWLWFADGSEFRNRLTAALSQRGLSVQLTPFLWSGANSVRERDKAARELVEHIRAKQVEYPSSTQVLIAHSHGGNVALRALNQLGVARDKIFTATMATPFIEILQTKSSPTETSRIEFMIAVTGSVPASQIPLVFGVQPGRLGYVLAFVPLILWPLFRRFLAWRTAKVDELVRLTSLGPSVRKHPILVLRAVDDEASLVLAFAAIGNRLSRLLTKWSYKVWVSLLFSPLAIIALLVLSAIIRQFQFGAVLLDFMARYLPVDWFSIKLLAAFQFWFLVAFFVLLLLPGAFKSFYGKELLLIIQGGEINSQSAPDNINRQSEFRSATESTPSKWGMVITLHQAEEAPKGRRHGLYNNPQCAERIAEWLQFELTSGGA
jgi:hypothetical protein